MGNVYEPEYSSAEMDEAEESGYKKALKDVLKFGKDHKKGDIVDLGILYIMAFCEQKLKEMTK